MTAGRALTIWLISLGVLLLIFTGAQLNPLVYLLAGVLAPLPVLLVGTYLGDRRALVLALAGIVFALTLNPGLAGLWQNLGFLSLLFMGLLLSVLQHRGLDAARSIILTVLILNGLALLLLLGQAFYQGVSPLALLAQRGAEILASVRQVMGEGAAAKAPLMPGVSQDDMIALMKRLLPGLVVVNSGLVAWINVILARQLVFLGGGRQPEPPLYHWALPEWLIFVAVGAGFLLFVPLAGLRYLCLNLLLILGVLYFCQGVAVVANWLIRLRLPRPLRVLAYILMFLNPLFFLIITLGVLDLWLDFRRLYRQTGDA